jgi:tRNA (adenine57-N1/adenine58-N1)-methyltransferase catalytic subunit
MSAPFEVGERAMLVDGSGHRYMVRLQVGATFHYHGGAVPHDLILGSDEGTEVHSATGTGLLCLRPRMADFILKMPRGAQVIYPKDIGTMLVYADVGPGSRVLEAGTGSAALTMALCRATGPDGLVVSYETREDFHRRATGNVESFFGKVPAWLDLRLGDVREVRELGETYDRTVLDLPEPWTVLEHVDPVLRTGGILCTFLPTTNQVQQAAQAMREAGYTEVETMEVMLRTWHVTDRSVRPDHRMVAHTGFLTIGRKIRSDGSG